ATEILDGLQVFRRLALGHEERALVDARVNRHANPLLGYDGGPGGADREHLEEAVAGATTHQDVVGAVAEGNGNGDHDRAATTRSTTSWGVRSSTSTMTSASSVYKGDRTRARRATSVAGSFPARSGRPAPLPTRLAR